MGAARTRVLGLVLGRGVRLVVLGLALGVSGALASGAAVAGLLWGVSARDALPITATATILSAIALLGTLVPALRATRVPPIQTLRTE